MNHKPFLILLTSCIASSFVFASPNANSAKLCANLDGYLLANCVANEHEKASKQLKKTFATVLGKSEVEKKIEELNKISLQEINKISGKKDFFVNFIDYMAKRTY